MALSGRQFVIAVLAAGRSDAQDYPQPAPVTHDPRLHHLRYDCSHPSALTLPPLVSLRGTGSDAYV